MPKQTDQEIEIFSASDPAEVEPVFVLLLENGIKCRVITPDSAYSPYVQSSAAADDRAKIVLFQEDHAAALEILKAFENPDAKAKAEKYRQELNQLDSMALLEILSSHDKYSDEKMEMAGILLGERDADMEPIEPDEVDEAKLMEPQEMSLRGIILWILFGMAMPVIAITVSIFVIFFKGETPSGQKYPLYSKRMKKIAIAMLIVPVLVWIVVIYSNYQLSSYSNSYW